MDLFIYFLSSDFQVFALPVAWALNFPSRILVFFSFLFFCVTSLGCVPTICIQNYLHCPSIPPPPPHTALQFPSPITPLRDFLLMSTLLPTPHTQHISTSRKATVPLPPCILPLGCTSPSLYFQSAHSALYHSLVLAYSHSLVTRFCAACNYLSYM